MNATERQAKIVGHLTIKETLVIEFSIAAKSAQSLLIKTNWVISELGWAMATCQQLQSEGNFTQMVSLLDKASRESKKIGSDGLKLYRSFLTEKGKIRKLA